MSQPDRIILLPAPRRFNPRPGVCAAGADRLSASIDPAAARPQGYRLSITPSGIHLIGHDAAGLFYGRQTLHQLARQFGRNLPNAEIEDWPDFPARGVMLDISRDKVPTMPTLYALVDRLAEWKVNQLQLYIEHTFAYRGHEDVWNDASPMTGEEARALDAYCRARFVELVPNQNSFGHMERWLKHSKYLPLAEAPDGAETPWGFRWQGPFSLCPTDARSVELLRGLYKELLPNFSSRLFNVGCDETFDIGQGRSRAECEAKGTTRVYLEFLRKVQALVVEQERTMMFWGDIILHHPDLIAELPKGAIAMEWGYEADHPFDRDGRLFREAGVPFYVCPGTSSWNSIAGRTENMLSNLRSAAESGLKHGAIGYLNTDWGDHGHLQYLPVSYAGFAAGAAFSWCAESNRGLNLPAVLDRHAFHDERGVLGKVACDLGNVYQAVGKLVPNASALFRVLVPTAGHKDPLDGITLEGLNRAETAIDRAIAPIGEASSSREDAALIADEFRNAAAMLRHACRRGRWMIDPTAKSAAALGEATLRIASVHRRLWLARNRPGGLEDSVRRIEVNWRDYEAKR